MATNSSPRHLERIDFTNHLMFNAVLTENEDLCKRLISAILGKTVEHIEYLDDEHTIQPELDAHGSRLDLLAFVDGEYVDIEMQVGLEPAIERRCRFYHGAIATRFTPKGAEYGSVPRSYVIFICLDDPLGASLSRYELATTCTNSPNVPVDDGAMTILLNASAWEQERNPEVAGMLRYTLTGRSESGLAMDIAKAVDLKNLDRKWVRASMGIMTYEHEFRALNAELDRRKAAVEAAQAELDAATSELEAATTELEAATTKLEDANTRLEAKTSELEDANTRLEAKTSELEDANTRLEAAQAELASATAKAQEAQALQELSKRLYAAGRIDEYFSALEDEKLMKTLLEELAS